VHRIHVQHDEEGPIEIVEEADGKLRSLQFGSPARQSTMFTARPHDLALEYTRSMAASLLFIDAPLRILVLGLGGGSLPKFFLHYFPSCRVDVVELRPAIIDVATRFFCLPIEDDRLQVIEADGLEFLFESPPACYDVVCIDLHDADGMAPVVDEEEFVPACCRVVNPGGVAVFNLWAGDRPAQEARLTSQLEQAFQPLLRLPVAGKRNCVAYGLTAAVPAPAVLAQRMMQGTAWSLPLGTVLTDLRRRYEHIFSA
jgi:spermidine synthase